jgi:DNA polymerase-3 subunit delta'
MYYPWQQSQWRQLWRAQKEQRLPHALLFSGVVGTGKAQFADHFSRALLCQQVSEEGEYCKTCHMCRLVEGKTHAGLVWIEPEKESGAIKIDQIREVREFINQTGLQSEYRIVIVAPANQMNINAANALLKTLEEPASGALLILICNQLSELPATVVSRCQHIMFPQPNRQEALSWLIKQEGISADSAELLLNVANGAPLTALRLVKDGVMETRQTLLQLLYALSQRAADPIKSAASLQSEDSLVMLDFILSFVMDLLRMQAGADTVTNQDFKTQLTDLSVRTELQRNMKFMENLTELRKQIGEGFNLNKLLTFEAVFIRWMECTKCF